MTFSLHPEAVEEFTQGFYPMKKRTWGLRPPRKLKYKVPESVKAHVQKKLII